MIIMSRHIRTHTDTRTDICRRCRERIGKIALRKRIKPEKSQLAPLARLAHDCIHDTVHIDLTFTYRTVRHTDRRYSTKAQKIPARSARQGCCMRDIRASRSLLTHTGGSRVAIASPLCTKPRKLSLSSAQHSAGSRHQSSGCGVGRAAHT
jgi:hypothetical protein